jgi:hypothetical protein
MALDEPGDLTHQARQRFGGRKIIVISRSEDLRSTLREMLREWNVDVLLVPGIERAPADWTGELAFVHTTALPEPPQLPARFGKTVLIGQLGTFGTAVGDDVLLLPVNRVALYACLSRMLPHRA